MVWSKTVILWIAGSVLITNVITNVVTYVTVEQHDCPTLPAPAAGGGKTKVGDGERF